VRAMRSIIPTMVGIFGLTSPALAGPSGSFEGLLVKAILANAAGECPASLMASNLKAACDQNLPTFIDTLTRLGPIKTTSFEGMRTLPSGPAEVYKVTFVHGEMTFIINTQGDGKALNLLAPDPPNWDISSYSSSSTAAQP
jgi:hypothetical protein